MRAELEQLHIIDQYLAGELSPEQHAAFEAKMKADPALKSAVEEQELLIKAVNRKALMAEIQSVAMASGAATTSWGLTQWLITGLSVVAVAVGSYFIYDYFEDEELVESNETTEENQHEPLIAMNTSPDTGEYFSFVIDTSKDELNTLLKFDTSTEYGDNTEPTSNKQQKRYIKNVNLSNTEVIEQDTFVQTGKLIASDQPVSKSKVNRFEDELEAGAYEQKLEKNQTAQFPGGPIAMGEWFTENLIYPGTPKREKLSATVKVSFIVNAEGFLSNWKADCFVIKNEMGMPLSWLDELRHGKSKRAFEEQAKAIFRKGPRWEPATDKRGAPVLSQQTWYVNFSLKGESSVYQLENDFEEITDGP